MHDTQYPYIFGNTVTPKSLLTEDNRLVDGAYVNECRSCRKDVTRHYQRTLMESSDHRHSDIIIWQCYISYRTLRSSLRSPSGEPTATLFRLQRLRDDRQDTYVQRSVAVYTDAMPTESDRGGGRFPAVAGGGVPHWALPIRQIPIPLACLLSIRSASLSVRLTSRRIQCMGKAAVSKDCQKNDEL